MRFASSRGLRYLSIVLLAPLLIASHGRAEPPAKLPIELRWDAAQDCPNSEYVLTAARRLVGDRELAPSRPWPVRVAVVREDAGWSAHVEAQTPHGFGERTLGAESCERLADAVALVIALAFFPDVLVPQSSPSDGSRTSVIPLLRPALVLDIGTLSGPSYAVGAALGVQYGRWRVEAQAAHGFSQRVARGPRPESSVELQAPFSAELRGCGSLLAGRVDLAACLALGTSELRAAASGVNAPGSGTGWGFAVLGGAAGDFALARWLHLRLEAALGAMLNRPTVVIEGYGEVHRVSPVIGRFVAGVEARWP